MFDGTHPMWGMHWAWWIFWIFLIVVILVAVWLLVKSRAPTTGVGPDARETPLERLQRRYAEGEISTEEYRERRAHLEGRP
jgi:putative membrane protein